MQDKQTNKNQLEDYFQAAANRGSMFSRIEIEQLISIEKTVKTDVLKRKTNATKILTIMTLITITIAALIWMINPAEKKNEEKESIVSADKGNNKTEETSSKITLEKEKSKTENKKAGTNNSKSEVKQMVGLPKVNNQKTEESKSVNDIKSADKIESKELVENQNVNTLISSSELQKKNCRKK